MVFCAFLTANAVLWTSRSSPLRTSLLNCVRHLDIVLPLIAFVACPSGSPWLLYLLSLRFVQCLIPSEQLDIIGRKQAQEGTEEGVDGLLQ
jgi:hypothetical protein